MGHDLRGGSGAGGSGSLAGLRSGTSLDEGFGGAEGGGEIHDQPQIGAGDGSAALGDGVCLLDDVDERSVTWIGVHFAFQQSLGRLSTPVVLLETGIRTDSKLHDGALRSANDEPYTDFTRDFFSFVDSLDNRGVSRVDGDKNTKDGTIILLAMCCLLNKRRNQNSPVLFGIHLVGFREGGGWRERKIGKRGSGSFGAASSSAHNGRRSGNSTALNKGGRGRRGRGGS